MLTKVKKPIHRNTYIVYIRLILLIFDLRVTSITSFLSRGVCVKQVREENF